jgi:hypothetical protein
MGHNCTEVTAKMGEILSNSYYRSTFRSKVAQLDQKVLQSDTCFSPVN